MHSCGKKQSKVCGWSLSVPFPGLSRYIEEQLCIYNEISMYMKSEILFFDDSVVHYSIHLSNAITLGKVGWSCPTIFYLKLIPIYLSTNHYLHKAYVYTEQPDLMNAFNLLSIYIMHHICDKRFVMSSSPSPHFSTHREACADALWFSVSVIHLLKRNLNCEYVMAIARPVYGIFLFQITLLSYYYHIIWTSYYEATDVNWYTIRFCRYGTIIIA